MILRVLDCAAVDSREGLHRQLKELLSLPDYCGCNLDGLADCLSELEGPVCLVLEHAPALEVALGEYARRFLRVLSRCAEENRRFTFALTGEGA